MGTPREDLADKLREARVSAGIGSQAALAQRLTVSRPLITKAESATHPVPSDQLLTAWAAVTDVPAEPLIALARRVKSGTPDWFMPFRQAEANAHTIRYWSPVAVPGITQSVAYMRSLFENEGHLLDEIDELVTARIERQSVIGHAQITIVISQHVLYRLVGSAAVMTEQCAHLASVAERPGVALHVLPESVCMGMWGALAMATQDSTTTLCLTSLEDINSTASDMVIKATHAYERLLGAALPRAESLALIRTAEGQWKTKTD
jgi:transcriptional regulator with XRE-family HTH domain